MEKQIRRKNSEQVEYIDLTNSLKFLTKYLREYHKSKVYLLIDEFDTPLSSMIDRTRLLIFAGSGMLWYLYKDK